ncbi:hypothetical protein [Rossellomorea sp. LJF3]
MKHLDRGHGEVMEGKELEGALGYLLEHFDDIAITADGNPH